MVEAGDAVANAVEAAGDRAGEGGVKFTTSSFGLGKKIEALGEGGVKKAVIAAEGKGSRAVINAFKPELVEEEAAGIMR